MDPLTLNSCFIKISDGTEERGIISFVAKTSTVTDLYSTLQNTGMPTVVSDPLCFLVRERGSNGCPHFTGEHVETPVKSRVLGC